GGIGDGLLAELPDDVAPPEPGTVGWAAGNDVGDEDAARDPEVQLERGLAGERLDAEPPALVVRRARQHRLVAGHLADRHGERHGLPIADHLELHRLPWRHGGDAALELGNLLDGRAVELDDDVPLAHAGGLGRAAVDHLGDEDALALAHAHWPTRSWSESPSSATGSSAGASTLSTARSVFGSRPTSFAVNFRPSERRTVMS